MNELNLYQKLLKITDAVGKIEKSGRGDGLPYKFIEQSMIVAKLRPLLAEHNVMIMPETTGRKLERVETTDKYGKAKVQYSSSVSMRFTVVNADKPEEKMVCEWDAGEALDSSDKASNKAVTAANKTFLMKLFNISEKDDPDAKREAVNQPETPVANFFAAKAELTQHLTKNLQFTLPQIGERVQAVLGKPRIETLEDIEKVKAVMEEEHATAN